MSKHESAKILFWNINRTVDNIIRILKYGQAEGIEIIALCEVPSMFPVREMFGYRLLEHFDKDSKRGIEVFIRDEIDEPKTYFREKQRYCLFRLESARIGFAIVHLNSDMTPNAKQYRKADIHNLMSDVESLETRYDKNTLLIGDFNINLFDESMTSITELNARYFKYQMKKQYEKKHEFEQDLFYNPMLQVYKDSFDEHMPCGTYYKNMDIEWYCYDHILMKYPLVNRFNNESLRLVHTLESTRMVHKNKLIHAFSDHLPIRFEIEKEG